MPRPIHVRSPHSHGSSTRTSIASVGSFRSVFRRQNHLRGRHFVHDFARLLATPSATFSPPRRVRSHTHRARHGCAKRAANEDDAGVHCRRVQHESSNDPSRRATKMEPPRHTLKLGRFAGQEEGVRTVLPTEGDEEDRGIVDRRGRVGRGRGSSTGDVGSVGDVGGYPLGFGWRSCHPIGWSPSGDPGTPAWGPLGISVEGIEGTT